jgi:hypothetical protein
MGAVTAQTRTDIAATRLLRKKFALIWLKQKKILRRSTYEALCAEHMVAKREYIFVNQ